MPITAKVGGQKKDPVPAGSHHAICYGVVAVGTQPSSIPEFKPAKKVILLWELPQERGDFGDKINVPRGISKWYTLSMHPKSNLRKDLESWRGRPFTDSEAAKFDIGTLIKANLMLNVVHSEKSGSTYSNVAALMPLPKGMNKMTNENPSLYFNLEEAINDSFVSGARDIEFPAGMPAWLIEDCKKSEEYTSFLGKASAKPAVPAPAPKQASLDTEEVPF